MALLDFLNRGKKEAPPLATPVLPRDIYAEGTLELEDMIAPAALKVGARELELGEKFARSFYTISYPRFLADSWFTPIINMDKVLDIGSSFIRSRRAISCVNSRRKWPRCRAR
jgi:hypothetical protein